MKRQQGFTLIEILMAIVIVSVLAVLAAPLLAVSIEAVTLQMDRINLVESAMSVTGRMTREIRRCRDEKSVSQATQDIFEFTDADGLLIGYRFSGGQLLRRQAAHPEQLMTGHLESGASRFSYFDSAGNLLASPSAGAGIPTDIRKVQIDLKLKEGTHLVPVRTSVNPRNLSDDDDLFS